MKPVSVGVLGGQQSSQATPFPHAPVDNTNVLAKVLTCKLQTYMHDVLIYSIDCIGYLDSLQLYSYIPLPICSISDQVKSFECWFKVYSRGAAMPNPNTIVPTIFLSI